MTVVVRSSDCDVVGQVREVLVNQVCRRKVGSFAECEVLPNGTKIGEGQL